MDLNITTFKEMQSLALIGDRRTQAIFEGLANISRPLTLLDLLEMGIPLDVSEIKAIYRHEEQNGRVEVQRIVVAALSSLHRIAIDVNGLSVAIDDVNRSQSHFESVLRAGWRIAGPKVECVELNTNQMAIATNRMSYAGSQPDSERCLSKSKHEHTKLAASNLFNNPGLQNGGGIDLVEYLGMFEEPSQTVATTVVSCSCSGSVRSR